MLSYVVIDQRYDKDTRLTVDYTLTNGEFANDIYAGEPLNDCANPDIDKDTLRFVTSAHGGEPSPIRKAPDGYVPIHAVVTRQYIHERGYTQFLHGKVWRQHPLCGGKAGVCSR